MKLFLITISLLAFNWSSNLISAKLNNGYKGEPANINTELDLDNDFSGVWINMEKENPFITKCKISYAANRYIVQMWGRCEPTDCDWGENSTNEVNREIKKIELLWQKVTFAESTITYEMIDGKLKLTNKRHFKDNSGRPDYTLVEYFIKQ
jgi:hypothetical protein